MTYLAICYFQVDCFLFQMVLKLLLFQAYYLQAFSIYQKQLAFLNLEARETSLPILLMELSQLIGKAINRSLELFPH